MNFTWLKRYVPRGLYGRAALILLLPIITLQLVVSVVFFQRHFEDVTDQMTQNLVLDLILIQQEISRAETLAEAQLKVAMIGAPLKLNVKLPAVDPVGENSRAFYDLSGRIIIRTLQQGIAEISAVDLLKRRRNVTIWMDTKFGVAEIWLSRVQVSASNPHQFLVLMVFVGVLMTFVSFVFLRNQLRPIKRLAGAAEAFGRGRVVDYRPAGALEVRSAGSAFLDMRARIERHLEQRTMMLSGVSHDLRTPLTRFRLGLSLLGPDSDTADLERDIDDMERLLDAFLSFARDDALDDPAEADPIALTKAAVERAERAGGNVKIGHLAGQGQMMLRPMAIERALDNLIGNGLRYGNTVQVSTELTGKSVIFSVEDDGPGIPADLRAEALKPFVRLDEARNQNRGSGVGLGLSIAHDIARSQGGTLRLGESQDLGGLRADIVLPR